MSNVEIRLYELPQGSPRILPKVLVDGVRITARDLELKLDRPLPPGYNDIDDRVKDLARNTSWGTWHEVYVDGSVLMETDKQPTRSTADDGATVYTWVDVQVYGRDITAGAPQP